MDYKEESSEKDDLENIPETEIVYNSMPAPNAVTISAEYHDYVEEMNNFITSHVQVTNSNAIELNEKFRFMLIDLRAKLENLRTKCAARYEANIEELKRSKKKINLLRGKFASYSSCGQPYFKNRNFYKAPPNRDYVNRKTQFKELFPLDLDYTFGHWTIHDKTTLIFGIKEQLINYLETCNVESRNSLRSNRLADLYKIGASFISSFRVNWNKLVLQNLKERHNVSETISMWNEYLHPHIRRGPWTSEEDSQLLQAAKKFNFQNWYEIAKMVPNRSKLQCMVHCHCVLFDRLRTRHTRWTKEEDELLLSLVKKYSLGKYIPWTKVTEQLPYRTKIQVYHRYIYTLNPDINHSRFTPEEDCVLLAAIQQYGKNYSDIPNDILPGRTQSQIRHRYNNVLQHTGKISFWSIDDDKKLMELVEKHGRSNWAEISRELSNHTRISCRTRHTVIKQYLDKHPDKTIDDVPRKKRSTFSKISEDNWLETLINLKNGIPIETEKSVAKHTSEIYSKKSSTIQRLTYDFFKYSYNFKYDSNPYGNFSMEFIQKNAILYSKLIDFDVRMFHIKLENNSMFNPFETAAITYFVQSINKFINVLDMENLSIIPPPTWDSMMLYRNLSLFTHGHELNEAQQNDINKGNQEPYHSMVHPALTKFKKRLALLLYYPYLLSKCNISNYVRPSKANEAHMSTIVAVNPGNSSKSFIIECIDEGDNLSKIIFEIEDSDPVPPKKKQRK